jgi:hypothetical protein
MAKEEARLEERIKQIEENQLRMAREFGKQGVGFFLTLAGMRIAQMGPEKYQEYEKYMTDSLDKSNNEISKAKSVDEAMNLAAKFTDECIEYTQKQLKK